MNRIKDRKLWWAVNFGTQHVKAPDYIPMPGLGLSIGLVLAIITMACLFATVVSAADSPHVGLAIIGARTLDVKQLREMAARIPKNIERKEATTPEQLEIEIKGIKSQIIEAIKAKADLATVTEMQRQLDALDIKIAEKNAGGGDGRTLQVVVQENDQLQRLIADKRGTAIINLKGADCLLIERKTVIDRGAVGFPTAAVMPAERTPGIVAEARQALRMRAVLASRPTSLGIIDFIKVNSAPVPASMQTESSAKAENAATFVAASQKVETIATWIPASKQVLDDWTELMGYLQNTLPYEVDLREEAEILFGNGTSPDLNGLYTQSTAFNTALLPYTPGWTKSDIVSCGIQQIQIAKEVDPTFIVLHPTDFWQIRRTKNLGAYLFSGRDAQDPFWGLQPIVTTAMSSGEFLIGSGSPVAAELRDRQEVQIAISTEHSDYFTKNLVAIRAEKRVALVAYRPGSYIRGTFNTSP